MIRSNAVIRYLSLAFIQTVTVICLIALAFPHFLAMLMNSGSQIELAVSEQLKMFVCVIGQQISYWANYCRMPKVGGPHVVLGHVLRFGGRISFIFGGGLFSAVYFRHAPLLESLPPIGKTITGTGLILSFLFALFCYSVELDRLGAAMENAPSQRGPEKAD